MFLLGFHVLISLSLALLHFGELFNPHHPLSLIYAWPLHSIVSTTFVEAFTA